MIDRIRWSMVAAVAIAGTGAAAARGFDALSARTASPMQFALTGITADQTARLSVSAVMDPNAPAGPCRAVLTFVGPQGQTLTNRDGEPAEKRVALQPGESAFLDFQAGSRDASRLDLRPVVFDRQDGSVPSGPCLPQLEIIDTATQTTLVINPGVVVGGWANHNETLVRDAGE